MDFLISRFQLILLALGALILFQNHVILTKMDEINEISDEIELPNNVMQIAESKNHSVIIEQNGRVGVSLKRGPVQPRQKENQLESFSGPVNDSVPHSCDVVPGNGTEGFGGYIVLEKIRKKVLEVQQEVKKSQNKRLPRVLCIVQTRRGRENLVESIKNTWGKRCDKLLVVSNAEVHDNSAINIPPIMGEDTMENLWQKRRAIWNFVYDKYVDEYEYFHL